MPGQLGGAVELVDGAVGVAHRQRRQPDEAVGMRLMRGAGAVVPGRSQPLRHGRLGEIEHGRGERQRVDLHAARIHVGKAQRQIVEFRLVVLRADEEAVGRFAIVEIVFLAVLAEDVEIGLRKIMRVDVDGAGGAGGRRFSGARCDRRRGAGCCHGADGRSGQPALQHLTAR